MLLCSALIVGKGGKNLLRDTNQNFTPTGCELSVTTAASAGDHAEHAAMRAVAGVLAAYMNDIAGDYTNSTRGSWD
jgi:hypothetical protein